MSEMLIQMEMFKKQMEKCGETMTERNGNIEQQKHSDLSKFKLRPDALT